MESEEAGPKGLAPTTSRRPDRQPLAVSRADLRGWAQDEDIPASLGAPSPRAGALTCELADGQD